MNKTRANCLPRLLSTLLCCAALQATLCPPVAAANDVDKAAKAAKADKADKAGKKTKADKAAKKNIDERTLARQLSETLALVAAEGKKFARSRDALAKARLQATYGLEDSLVELRETRAITLQAWEVVGEDYRLRLFNGVIAGTTRAAEQYEARARRRVQQQSELAKTRSAVAFQGKKLLAAAKGLAALAEPPARGDASELLNQLASELTGSADLRSAIVDAATGLVKESGASVIKQALGDKAATPSQE